MTEEREEKPLLHLEEFRLKQDPEDYGLADDLINIDTFKKKFRLVVVKKEDHELEFDMIGVHPSFANALRRIMLSEVPSMAIEKVYVYNNTSIIQDEVLAHRLGLLPLKADPRRFDYKADEKAEGTEIDTLEYELKVKCVRRKDASDKCANFDAIYKNSKVYSGQMKWIPKGSQANIFKESDVKCIFDDILLAKLRPGHELDLRLLAVKGLGMDHAKFSPVATAHYRLMPHITLNREYSGDDAITLKQCFSPGVIGIDAEGKAFVENARYDTCSRNVYRFPALANGVNISRIRDHFIFNVESVGALDPADIFIEAVKVLKAKCLKFQAEIESTSR